MTDENDMNKSTLLKAFESFLDTVTTLSVGKVSPESSGLKLMKSMNEELMQETSVVYLPNTPDGHDQWMSKETVSDMRDRLHKGFLEDGTLTLNLWHKYPLPKEEAEVLEVSLLKTEMEIEVDGVLEVLPEGTCCMTTQYHNPQLWKMRKKGVIGGFSVEGKCKIGNTQ